MISRDEYLRQLKAQMELWERHCVAWESGARSATREAKLELEKQVGILKSRLDDMAFRAEQLRGASADAWQEIARGADEARKAIEDAFEKARTRLKDV